MNRFISTISLISLTSVAGIFAATAGVNAQTVDQGQVEMTATVGDVCLFTEPLDGNLGINPLDLTTLTSSFTTDNGITAEPGTPGSIDVTCNNASSTISISSVTEAIPSGITSNSYTATVTGLASSITSTNGAAATPVAVGDTSPKTLTVNLEAGYGATNVIPGNYTYTVNLVANP